MFNRLLFTVLFISILSSGLHSQDKPELINDVTQLNPIAVQKVISPATTEEIVNQYLNTVLFSLNIAAIGKILISLLYVSTGSIHRRDASLLSSNFIFP